jgi:hypothetical protein
VIPPVATSNMGDDNDDLDNWETDVIEPVDTAVGVIPAWLEAALFTEAAGCPLHARAAYSAIMRFFIGFPASKGLFFRQLWRKSDPFHQMRESLGAIMRVVARNNKFPFPLVAFLGSIYITHIMSKTYIFLTQNTHTHTEHNRASTEDGITPDPAQETGRNLASVVENGPFFTDFSTF